MRKLLVVLLAAAATSGLLTGTAFAETVGTFIHMTG